MSAPKSGFRKGKGKAPPIAGVRPSLQGHLVVSSGSASLDQILGAFSGPWDNYWTILDVTRAEFIVIAILGGGLPIGTALLIGMDCGRCRL